MLRLILALSGLATARAQAHEPSAPGAAAASLPWNFEPWLVALLYALGTWRLWRRAGRGGRWAGSSGAPRGASPGAP